MKAKENAWANAYADFVLRNRWVIIILLVLATIAAALQIHKLDIRNDPDTLLPPSNRYVATNLYAEHNFGMGNLMVFALRVKEGDIYQPWFINKVQEIHHKLEALPHSRAANFIDIAAQKIKFMGADENGLVFKRLIPTEGISDDPAKAKEQLAFLHEGVKTNPVMAPDAGLDVGRGRQPLRLRGLRQGPLRRQGRLHHRRLQRRGEGDLPALGARGARHDGRIRRRTSASNCWSPASPTSWPGCCRTWSTSGGCSSSPIAIVIAVLWLEFRNWRGALFPLLGVGMTIAMTLGLMGFTAFKLTTMMVLTPMLLLAIGIGHSVQVTRRFMLEQRAQRRLRRRRPRARSRHTIVPATLSIITDMVGFATLATVDISFYKAYAYFGMFGMLTLLFTTTTLIPLLLTVFPPSRSAVRRRRGTAGRSRVGGFLTRLITGPGKWVPIGVVLLVTAGSVYFTNLMNWQGNPEDEVKLVEENDFMPGVEKGINYARAAFKGSSDTWIDLVELNKIMPASSRSPSRSAARRPNLNGCLDEYFPDEIYDIEDPIEKAQACDKAKTRLGCWDADACGAQGVFNTVELHTDLEKMENWMRAHEFIGYTGSYTQYVRLVNMLLTAEPGEPTKLSDLRVPNKEYLLAIDPDDDRSPTEIVQMYNGLLEAMTSAGDMDSFVNTETWNEGVILGFINTMDPVETHKVTMDIQQYIEEHKNDPGFPKVNFGLRNADTSGDSNELSVDGPVTYDRVSAASSAPPRRPAKWRWTTG